MCKVRFVAVILLIGAMSTAHVAEAKTYFVDKNHSGANDANSGAESQPFASVQQGLNSVGSGDTVFIRAGTYTMSGFSTSLTVPVTIIGKDKDSTILDNMGMLDVSKSFTLKNVQFTNYAGALIKLVLDSGETLDGLNIKDCIFGAVEFSGAKTRVIRARYGVTETSVITNVNIENCDFLGMKGPGVSVLYFHRGMYSNVNISNNHFYNLIGTTSNSAMTAVLVGSGGMETINHNNRVTGNYFHTLIGGDTVDTETHAVLMYGTDLSISNNTVINMNPGNGDHEALYMKAINSVISGNVLIDCTAPQGAIAIKSSTEPRCHDNTISGNKIQSKNTGIGLYAAGVKNVTMSNNYVYVPNCWSSLYIYQAYNTPCVFSGNYSETKRNALYLRNSSGGEISGNTLVSYDGDTMVFRDTTENITFSDNTCFVGVPQNRPVAAASASVTEGAAPLSVTFSSAGTTTPSGQIVSYEWDFHDGEKSTSQNPNHVFTEARTYAATLIVTNTDGFKDMSYVLIRVKKGEDLPVYAKPAEQKIAPNAGWVNVSSLSGFATVIKYAVPHEALVSVNIFDIKGALVKYLLTDRFTKAGIHEIHWDNTDNGGRALGSGEYYCNVVSGNSSVVKGVIVVK